MEGKAVGRSELVGIASYEKLSHPGIRVHSSAQGDRQHKGSSAAASLARSTHKLSEKSILTVSEREDLFFYYFLFLSQTGRERRGKKVTRFRASEGEGSKFVVVDVVDDTVVLSRLPGGPTRFEKGGLIAQRHHYGTTLETGIAVRRQRSSSSTAV